MLPPARTIAIDTTAADRNLVGGASVLTFWSFIETTGSDPAEVALYDGDDDTGALIVPISLDAGQSTRDTVPLPCLGIRQGLFLKVVSGSVKGSVWVIPGEVVDAFVLTQGWHSFWSGSE